MVVVVTGGAGFIGRHLARRLARKGYRVLVFDNLSRSVGGGLDLEGIECIQGDIRDVSSLRRTMVGCEMLFHLAAQATVMGCEQYPVEAHEVNATGTL